MLNIGQGEGLIDFQARQGKQERVGEIKFPEPGYVIFAVKKGPGGA